MTTATQLQEWIELENGYLTDQKAGEKNAPPPTEYYLFIYKAKRDKRGHIRRKRELKILTGRDQADLEAQTMAFAQQPNVVVIPSVENVEEYLRCGLEPVLEPLSERP